MSGGTGIILYFAVHTDSARGTNGSSPQSLPAASHSSSRVTGANRAHAPVAPATPSMLPSPSQTVLPSLIPSGLISSLTRRRQDAAGDQPQAGVDCGFHRSDHNPPSVSRPILRRESRAPVGPPRLLRALSAQFRLYRSSTPKLAANPAQRLVGVLPLDAPLSARTPAALPEIPTSAELEFLESVQRSSHTDWAQKQRAEPVCDAAIRHLLSGSPLVPPDEFLLRLPSRKRPPLSEVRSLADKGHLYAGDNGLLLLVRKLAPPAPAHLNKPDGRAARLLNDEPVRIYVPLLMRPWIMQACTLTRPTTSASLVYFLYSNAYTGGQA